MKKIFFLAFLWLSACGPSQTASQLLSISRKVPRFISLRCSPYQSSDLQGSLKGEIEINQANSQILGRVMVTTKGFPGREGTYQASISGYFVPADPKDHFKTNYINASFSSGLPISGASISFWPERDVMPFSAIYDKDGFRFGMNCSSSVFHN